VFIMSLLVLNSSHAQLPNQLFSGSGTQGIDIFLD
jgi:hypothetical protein